MEREPSRREACKLSSSWSLIMPTPYNPRPVFLGPKSRQVGGSEAGQSLKWDRSRTVVRVRALSGQSGSLEFILRAPGNHG